MAKKRTTAPPKKTGDKAWDTAMHNFHKNYGKKDANAEKELINDLSKGTNTIKPKNTSIVAVFIPGEVELDRKGNTTKVERVGDNVVTLTFPDDPADIVSVFDTSYRQLEQLCKGHEKAFAGIHVHIGLPNGELCSMGENFGGIPVGDYWADKLTTKEQAMLFFGQVLTDAGREVLHKYNDVEIHMYLIGCLIHMAAYVKPESEMSKLVK